ncbi:hypothetical protein ACFLVN_01520 [Chloroflexota bacterium]
MENFVIWGKAKTVFQIIELMAQGEELTKKREADKKRIGLIFDSYDQLWPASN